MNNDKVIKYNFKKFLIEMSHDAGTSMSILDNQKIRMYWFETSKFFETYKIINDNIKVVREKYLNNSYRYFTNDYNLKETIHLALIIKHTNFDFIFEEQNIVNRYKNANIPKRYATNFIYDYFLKSKYPLRTSEIQYKDGHQMWKLLVDMALNDNNYVYYYDNNLIQINDTNKNEYLNLYFGKNLKTRHIFLSKTKLELK